MTLKEIARIINFMETIIKKIDRNKIDEDTIEEAGYVLHEGGLVAFPTETVYGLGANALDEDAALKTYAAKGRPSDNPLIVHISQFGALERIVKEIPEKAVKLAERFWPGPLTMIFEKNELVPYGTTGGLETVAVRMPSDVIAQKLITSAGGYVSAPSANTSGRPSPTTAQHVMDDLGGRIDMIVDAGSVDIGVESTIVDMTVEPPMILRPGAVTKEMLQEAIGEVTVDSAILLEDSKTAPKAPGMKYRHYAPKAQLILVEGEEREVVRAIRQMTGAKEKKGFKTGIITTSETANMYPVGVLKNVGTKKNESSIAKNLYRVLREFDEENVQYIYCESFARAGIGEAVMNRLVKAAGHKIVCADEITKLQSYMRILFVSDSGNCRGPMAAAQLKKKELLRAYEIDTRGMIVLFPEPPNQKAEAVSMSHKVTLQEFVTKPFEEEDLDGDTLVLTMEESQKEKLKSDYAHLAAGGDIQTLGEYLGITGEAAQVRTAYGQPLAKYGEVFEQLNAMTDQLAEKLNEEAKEYDSDWM